MILGRQEAFASKRPVGRALLDAFGTGIGFMIALLILGTFREILGSGTVLGFPIFGPNFEPWVVFVLPPGGFLTIGFVLLGLNAWQKRRDEKAAAIDGVSGVPQEEAA
jgi:electron transport complex protein RnfE